jgi:NTE family protein
MFSGTEAANGGFPAARLFARLAARRNGTTPRAFGLALQGGGSHGAFSWGVLDRLLEEPRFAFDGVSGASAGAVNAVVLLSGWLNGGRDGARQSLAALWEGIGDLALMNPLRWDPVGFAGGRGGQASPMRVSFDMLTRTLSPYLFNPLDVNPLRQLLDDLVDFERIRDPQAPHLFVSATSVHTGRGRIFRNHEMTADVVLASASLPHLHHAVRVGDEWYWDGGLSANPPLMPLAEQGRSGRILLVQLTPTEVAEVPLTAPEIRARLGQIVFNAPLLHELQLLEMDRRSAGRGLRRRRPVDLHCIDATEAVQSLAAGSALEPSRALLSALRQRGRAAAEDWLSQIPDL